MIKECVLNDPEAVNQNTKYYFLCLFWSDKDQGLDNSLDVHVCTRFHIFVTQHVSQWQSSFRKSIIFFFPYYCAASLSEPFHEHFCSLKEESDDEEEREKGTRYLLRRWVGTQDKEWLCWPVRRRMSFHHWGPMRDMSQGWGTKRLTEEPEIQAVIFPFLKVMIFVTGRQSQYGGTI